MSKMCVLVCGGSDGEQDNKTAKKLFFPGSHRKKIYLNWYFMSQEPVPKIINVKIKDN